MPGPDFALMSYADVKTALFRCVPAETADRPRCETALAALDVLQVTRPSESEHAGSRIALSSLEAMRQKFEKRLAVLGWNARPIETVVPTDDLQ